MENPLHILETGTIGIGHGCKSNIANGVGQAESHVTLLSSTRVTISENGSIGLIAGIDAPILPPSCSTSQDGDPFHNDDPTVLLRDKEASLLSAEFASTEEYQTVTDVDAEKVDEWLKGRTDNTPNPITYEFDSEMKATQDDIFPDERSLLEDVHLNLTCKDQLVSVAELLGTSSNSAVPISKSCLKSEVTDQLNDSSLQLSSDAKLVQLDISEVRSVSPKDLESSTTFTSPYIVDSSQLDLVEVPEIQPELENHLIRCKDEQIVTLIGPATQGAESLTTVSIIPESKDFVYITIKSGATEQVFRVKSSVALDPNQALSLENLVSQPVILAEDEVPMVPTELESSVAVSEALTTTINESVSLPENVEVSPWIPSLSRVRGKLYECPFDDCEMNFTKESKLRVHVLGHGTNRSHKCTFADCDWAFNSEYRLKRHLISHMGKKNYTCSECNRQFTTTYNLKSHQVLHQRLDNVLCTTPGCGKAFATRRKMELHLREHEEIEAPYKCPFVQCGKRFYSANYLSSHLKGHQYSKEDLSCPIEGCGRSFARICQLKQHMRQHTGERPYVCDFPKCGWKFSSASKLTRHVRKHTGERKYVCPEPGCNKSFMRPEHLKGHIIVHSGGRPFVCEIPNCNARFTAKSSLYVHMKKHTGDSAKAIFPCPVAGCTKKYNFKAHLRQHMLKVHASVLVGHGGSNSSAANTLLPDEGEEEMEPGVMDAFEDHDKETTALNLVATGTSEGALLSFPESGSTVDVPQLIIPDNLSQHLSQDLLALASEGQLTLTSDSGGQILINPADLLTTSVVSEADQAAHSLLADMDQLLLGVGVEEVCPAGATSMTASSPLDNVSGVLGNGPAIEVADGGSARTDYSSNLILSSRAKRRRQLQQQFRQQELESSGKCDSELPALEESSGMLSAADVVLSSSSISLRDSEITPSLLPDEPPASDIYPDDNILTSELPSLLNEPSTINPESEIFVVPTIHLSDLV